MTDRVQITIEISAETFRYLESEVAKGDYVTDDKPMTPEEMAGLLLEETALINKNSGFDTADDSEGMPF